MNRRYYIKYIWRAIAGCPVPPVAEVSCASVGRDSTTVHSHGKSIADSR
ncbi:MAG: hypothetical protein RID09_30035 [Coleofasciculus sp. G1-WW12-02]